MATRWLQWFPLVLVALAFMWAIPLQAGSKATGPEYVYTSNFGDFTVSGFSVNTETGKLTKITGSPFPAGIGPEAFAASRNGHFLYLSLGEWSDGRGRTHGTQQSVPKYSPPQVWSQMKVK